MKRIHLKNHIILVDPPWKYKVWSGEKDKKRTADSHYKTMSLEDMFNLKSFIDDVSFKNSVLFMWITPPTIRDAFNLIDHWGFDYKTFGFVWLKLNKGFINPSTEGFFGMDDFNNQDIKNFWKKVLDNIFLGLGHYSRANVEICLFCTKGEGLKIINRSVSQVIVSPLRKHSQKPIEAYEKIESMYGKGFKKIELFARNRRDNWRSWGNEL